MTLNSFAPVSTLVADGKLLEQQRFATEQICKVFRVDPKMVGVPSVPVTKGQR